MAYANRLHELIPSTMEEKNRDWHEAEVYCAFEVLIGDVKLTELFDSSYHWIEDIWLKEVKQLWGYLVWSRKGEPFDLDGGVTNYFKACDELRDRLFAGATKKSEKEEFHNFCKYLKEKYFFSSHFDPNKLSSRRLLERKAQRVHQVNPQSNATADWLRAESYVCEFYNHIIPAIVDRDRGSTSHVLKAFADSENGGWPFSIVNCFEATLAIYFLDPTLVEGTVVL